MQRMQRKKVSPVHTGSPTLKGLGVSVPGALLLYGTDYGVCIYRA